MSISENGEDPSNVEDDATDQADFNDKISKIAFIIGFCLFGVALVIGVLVQINPNYPIILYKVGGVFLSLSFLSWGLALSLQTKGLPPKAIFWGIVGLGCFVLTFFLPEWFYWFFIVVYIIMLIGEFFG
ncbi:MAG: hypothetical protein ACFFCS_09720 [Candidatus Hodarchaeota archaeon]